jgi:hypothetical protein
MKKWFTLFLFAALTGAVISSCKKDEEEPGPCDELGSVFLKAKIDGDQFCANTTLFADYTILLTVNGMMDNGATLTLELDSLQPGTYEMGEMTNHALYTSSLAMGYETTDDNPGTLIITSHNEATNRIKGTFSATLRNPLGGDVSLTSGSFDLVYTE